MHRLSIRVTAQQNIDPNETCSGEPHLYESKSERVDDRLKKKEWRLGLREENGVAISKACMRRREVIYGILTFVWVPDVEGLARSQGSSRMWRLHIRFVTSHPRALSNKGLKLVLAAQEWYASVRVACSCRSPPARHRKQLFGCGSTVRTRVEHEHI